MKTLRTFLVFIFLLTTLQMQAQENWEIIESPTVQDLTSITFFTPEIGIITGHGGTLLRTEDGGLNWVVIVRHRPPAIRWQHLHLLNS